MQLNQINERESVNSALAMTARSGGGQMSCKGERRQAGGKEEGERKEGRRENGGRTGYLGCPGRPKLLCVLPRDNLLGVWSRAALIIPENHIRGGTDRGRKDGH